MFFHTIAPAVAALMLGLAIRYTATREYALALGFAGMAAILTDSIPLASIGLGLLLIGATLRFRHLRRASE